jgi:hypothetical protein
VPPETLVQLTIQEDVGSTGWREREEEKGVDVFDGECKFSFHITCITFSHLPTTLSAIAFGFGFWKCSYVFEIKCSARAECKGLRLAAASGEATGCKVAAPWTRSGFSVQRDGPTGLEHSGTRGCKIKVST